MKIKFRKESSVRKFIENEKVALLMTFKQKSKLKNQHEGFLKAVCVCSWFLMGFLMPFSFLVFPQSSLVWIAWLVVVLSSSVLRHKLDRTLERQILFKGMTFPIVRRAFPNLYVNDIVSVQPMSKPSSTLFYFQYPNEHNHD